MRVYLTSDSCGHMVATFKVASFKEVSAVIKTHISGRDCNECGQTIKLVTVHFKANELTDELIRKANTLALGNVYDVQPKFDQKHVDISTKLMKAYGGEATFMATSTKESVLHFVKPTLAEELLKIPVGTAPTFVPNARTIKCGQESSIPFILFHRGIFRFIWQMNFIVVKSLNLTEFEGSQKVHPPQLSEEEAAKVMEKALSIFFSGEQDNLDDLQELNDLYLQAFELGMRRSILAFILAHEYAHVVLHMDDNGDKRGMIDQEYEADKWAQKLLSCELISAKKPPGIDQNNFSEEQIISNLILEFSEIGPLLFFLYCEVLYGFAKNHNKAQFLNNQTRHGVESYSALESSHPAPMLRFEKMAKHFDETCSYHHRDLVRIVAHILSDVLERVCDRGIDHK